MLTIVRYFRLTLSDVGLTPIAPLGEGSMQIAKSGSCASGKLESATADSTGWAWAWSAWD